MFVPSQCSASVVLSVGSCAITRVPANIPRAIRTASYCEDFYATQILNVAFQQQMWWVVLLMHDPHYTKLEL